MHGAPAALTALAFAVPGSLYLYQGEELGLPEVFDIPDDRREDPVFHLTNGEGLGRDGCRIPLPWTADPATSFGFSNRDRLGARRSGRRAVAPPTGWMGSPTPRTPRPPTANRCSPSTDA